MILWTIQNREAWEELQKKKVLRVREKRVYPHFLPAYEWLVGQMKQRMGEMPVGCEFPIWAWYQWLGKRRPDLRAKHVNPGEAAVRLEIELSDEDILLSDCDLWIHVLNGFYLPASEKDNDRFERKIGRAGLGSVAERSLPEPFRSEMVKSWERIFDIEGEDPYITYPNGEKHIQATFWELRLDCVRKVDYFVGR